MASYENEKEEAHSVTLFGGDEGWSPSDWTASDDRVRGGKSQSYLDCSNEKIGRFCGHLDIKTLGGAGFASQRTTGDNRKWDLSKYAGIKLDIEKGDKKRYTFILKDELLAPNPENGREQASISYEADFELPPPAQHGSTHDSFIFIPWESLKPTYRGKLKEDAEPLDTKQIKRISIMMRSFFGTQEGDFTLSIRSITTIPKAPEHGSVLPTNVDVRRLEDGTTTPEDGARYYHLRPGNWFSEVSDILH
ncbi:hypothetical protein LTR36_001031 [Oleoguttula mirabilis]|uniref:NADH:ubiquinone oxidoreductase intermediate-associated protein 30 domain-containing protein n=1 Tax=Oleoguttula mirabilis TaxID=1507867 RepID=A0AAV9JPX0_9PEZI|nr:hypothetical protein LTR36_001031 [Oleoguttula mirabilis]